ncbi:MAG TPA: hypothetical protein VHW47_00935 [Acidimicrobiales bacterium]|nr:hypothetical protein [Acidimicrobiales bacterium]
MVSVRFTPEELDRIRKASPAGNVSGFIREAVLRAMRSDPPSPSPLHYPPVSNPVFSGRDLVTVRTPSSTLSTGDGPAAPTG